MEKFKKVTGRVVLEKMEDGYSIHDDACLICGSLGVNDEKALDMISRVNTFNAAIELLKEFAFYDIDLSVEDYCVNAVKVQEFLKTTYATDWMNEQLIVNECIGCDEYDECHRHDVVNEVKRK
ncbi:MAG: hypothetical protein K0R80_1589 [Clostridia bacterium]|nr:hypothetical protein [Clostridia bacterium]